VFDVDALLAQTEPRPWVKEPMVVEGPGLGNTRFDPGQPFDDPLQFTYLANNDHHALVSRTVVGREFFYKVPIVDIQQFQQAWVFRTVGRNTAGMAIVSQLIVEISISFIPIIGPLFNLTQTGLNVYQASQHWGKMKGWEKALLGVDVLLTAVTGFSKGLRAGKGLLQYQEGVKALRQAGVSQGEARTLMLAAGVFQDVPATRRVVETLAGKLEGGGSLAAKEIVEVENIASEMLKRLPAAERTAQAARFAMRDIETAREFFTGLTITDDVFDGLRNLSPEVLAGLQGLVKEERLTLALMLAKWSRTPAVATGMNDLVTAVRPSHITEVAAALGEDALRMLGSGEIHIAEQLAIQVAKESGSSKAYQTLMKGLAPRNQPRVPGLVEMMHASRQSKAPLSDALLAVQTKLPQVFLTEGQLAGVTRLGEKTLAMLSGAPDSQVRNIATIAAHSEEAARSIDTLVASFGKRIKPNVLPGIFERLGPGMLEALERRGITLGDDVIAAAARESNPTRAAQVLLLGGEALRGKPAIGGAIDALVLTLESEDALKKVLDGVGRSALGSEIFSRWAVKNPQAIAGVEELIKLRPDAQARIASIHLMFRERTARTLLEEIGWLHKAVVADRGVPPDGLNALVADLGAGPAKAMGASLVIDFASKQAPTSIAAFEQTVTGLNVVRKYDLVAGGKYYEFKYWLGFGGEPVAAAADEFARDVMLHAHNGFADLRWVISTNAQPYAQAIGEMFHDTLLSRRAALEAAGHDFAQVEASLAQALSPSGGWLLSFF
jgi:hypothetical protein